MVSPLTSRRLFIAAIIFAIFVVFDIFLFGWLIFNSLSQREVEKVLLKTRAEAEPLARMLEERARSLDQDLYVTLSVVQEKTTFIESFPTQREMIRRFEIREADGTVVYQEESTQVLPLDDADVRVETGKGSENPEIPYRPPELDLEEVELPIGDLGTIVIGLSKQQIGERIGVLRQDLIRMSTLIGILTLTLLVAAFIATWMLFRRAQRLEEQAVEAERLAYIGTLASGLAHEIRNPLNSLSLNMQMLEEESDQRGSNSAQKRLLSITRSELHRLERLATDFLSYAKPRPLDFEEGPAVELLERVLEVMGGEIQERGVVVEIEDSSGGARVRVDHGQINQLLINLTQNALAAAEHKQPGVVRLIARRQASSVVLEVTDNGLGISLPDQQRMFDLFYSTRKGGTGLGLAIVKRIAKAHDAELEVESELGVGTTVRIRLAEVAGRRQAVEQPGAEVLIGG